jgi:hypothetical protein
MTTEALARSILGVLNEAQITYRIINLAWSNHSRSTPFFTSTWRIAPSPTSQTVHSLAVSTHSPAW